MINDWFSGNDSGEDKLSLIDVERKLRDEVAQLQKEKDERMKAYDEARAAEKIECESTGSVPCYIVINRMPTDEQVRQIKKNVSHLRVIMSSKARCGPSIYYVSLFLSFYGPHSHTLSATISISHS